MSTRTPEAQQGVHRAALLLRSLGWLQIPAAPRGSENDVLLHEVLEQQLLLLNSFEHQGSQARFSEAAIREAIQALRRPHQEDAVYSNEKIWSLLKFGTQVRESIDDDVKTVTIRFIDWEQPRNNSYHFIEDFAVEGHSEIRRIDIVLFVNGIPFAALEEKTAASKGASRKQLESAIEQLVADQSTSRIAQLFRYTQLLFAVSTRDAAYATVGTKAHQWSQWRESHGSVEPAQAHDLPSHVNERDQLIHALCRPERLLEMARWFTLFISGRRYIARYHQYFAVHAVLARVSKPELDGRRPGGVIMHTQGSGKTLTMVMLSQVLLDVFRERAPRVLLVTDRTEADDNLHDVLLSSGVECRRATTGRELRNLLQDRRARAITTVIHKFHAAVNAPTLIADSPDIFVLIDEAHRTQTGRLHYAMRQMLPRACFIAFTGTPLDTRAHDIFGEYLSTYRWDDAVQDNVVVPMRWELRNHVMKDVSEAQWWPLADTADDPTPFDHEHDTTIAAFLEVPSRVHAIATDVAQHFNQHFAGSNFKGQLIASSRTAALLFKKFFDAIGTVTSEVAISLDGSAPDLLHYEEFRRQVLAKYGTEAKYQADLVRRFAEADDPKILISVERLITGLDVPRCSVMYIARPLRGPTLLQAIARANRRHEGKTHGLIVDYLDLSREIRDAVSLGLDLKAAEPATAQTAPPLAPKSLLDQQSRDQPAGIFSALKESCLNILHEELGESGSNVTATSVDALAQRIAETILIRRKVDWIEDLDLQNQMKIFIEDELFEMQSNEGIVLDLRRIDAILDRCIASARQISA